MKFITRDTDYALKSLVHMAKLSSDEKRSLATVREIARSLRLPQRFLRRILQKLARDKILSSYKGKDGGFSFLKPPQRITVMQIIEIFQGRLDLTNCLLRDNLCPDARTCVMREILEEMTLWINKKLNSITIATLLKEDRHGKKKNSQDR